MPAVSESLTFPVAADTYVNAGSPSQALGAQAKVSADASPICEAYLRFAVSGVPPFAVERATLRLTVSSESGSPSDVGGTVHSMTDGTWSEAVTTYNARPVVDGPALATAGAVEAGQVVDFDVTPAVLADGTYNFALRTTSSNAVNYRSREAGAAGLLAA